jgi:hypothetical protein
MSIFNQPIHPDISASLARRQDLMGTQNRTSRDLAFLNSQTTWVSLKSSVNVDGTSFLARANVLSAGLHSNVKLGFNQLKFADPSSPDAHLNSSYALNNADTNTGFGKGSANLLGVKPMPGITSVSVDNIGAYGSLRKATVNFQCWDVKQLEILEKLYMRPGYTVLLEFGRSSYIDEKDKLVNTSTDLTFFNKKEINLHNYLNELHEKSIKQKGNYDAFFGYITNYGWSARNDGGYDCKTEIISTGEILESLKSNYSLSGLTDYISLENNPLNAKFKGLILPNYNAPVNISNYERIKINKTYSDNIISGLMYELFLVISNSTQIPFRIPFQYTKKSVNNFEILVKGKKINIDYAINSYTSTGDPQDINDPNLFSSNGSNVYITLRSFIELFNTFILPKSFDQNGNNNGELALLSVDDRSYVSKDPLLCLYNSLMLSTNPDVCWIKNNSWSEILSGLIINVTVNPVDPTKFSDPDIQNGAAVRQKLIKWINYLVTHDEDQNETVINQIKADRTSSPDPSKYYEILSKNYSILRGGKDPNNSNLFEWGTYIAEGGTQTIKAKLNALSTSFLSSFLMASIGSSGFTNQLNTFGGLLEKTTNYLSFTSEKNELKKISTTVEDEVEKVQQQTQNAQAQQQAINNARTDLVNLSDNLKNFNVFFKDFVTTGGGSQFGTIGNIYINLKHAFRLAKNPGLLSQDQAGHNKLSISSFFKQLLQDIQTSLGNVNQFEFHIDPIDSIGRIIDLNYINTTKSPDLFKFEIGSNKSIVRDLKLESQIFSDQSSIIAISAQDQAGALGSNNSTLVGFNDGVTDRLMPRKDSYLNDIHSREKAESTLIYNYISSLSYITSNYLKNLLGANTTIIPATVGNNVTPYGKVLGGSAAQVIVSPSAFSPDQSLSFSNALRDIMYFFTSVSSFNESNKEKQFIPTLLSLTIDGLSGFIIGNLFKVDDKFVPNYYKKGEKLGYTITKVNHELTNNDWITTISGYPFNLDANVNSQGGKLIPYIISKKVVIVIDPNPTGNSLTGGPNSTSTLANKSFNDIIKDIAARYSVKYSSKVHDSLAALEEKFSQAMTDMFTSMAQDPNMKNEVFDIISLRRNDNTFNHPKGQGLDFQLGATSTEKAITRANYSKYPDTLEVKKAAKSGKPYSDPSRSGALEVIYGKNQLKRIEAVYRYIATKFGVIQPPEEDRGPNFDEVSIRLNINGIKIRMINENFYPSEVRIGKVKKVSQGPHFHFQLM